MKLSEILEKHKNWCKGVKYGEKADLSYADLRDTDLRDTDLRCSNFRGSDLSGSDLSGSDLRGANFCDADLGGAILICSDFSGADLRNANLIGADLLVLTLPLWTAYIHKTTVRIGCKNYKHEEWLAFSDNEINAMDSKALGWWKQYKPIVEAGINSINKIDKRDIVNDSSIYLR